jgi:CTP:molybdopterin cytidylyltransferase MocA
MPDAAAALTRPDVAMLVLASGRGERMGGPKALLRWTDGAPIVASHAKLGASVCGGVVVVARASVARMLRPLLPEAMVVPSSAPGPWGPAGSIAAAVRAGTLAGATWTLITPVDAVPAAPSTVRLLLNAVSSGVQAVRPRFEGRGGHPVIVRSDVVTSAYLARRPPPLRDVLRELDCVDVEVADRGVVADLNTPEAYRAWTGQDPRFAVSDGAVPR